jgi:hypothetical protein
MCPQKILFPTKSLDVLMTTSINKHQTSALLLKNTRSGSVHFVILTSNHTIRHYIILREAGSRVDENFEGSL